MFYKISNYILDNFLYKGQELDDEKREIMNFGIVRIIEDIPKYIGIFLIALFLNILKELFIVYAVNMVYKTFVGGAHARTNLICFISSTIFFILPILVAKYITLPSIIQYIIYFFNFVFSIYVIVKIAPADTEEVPIINKERRKKLKVGALISITLIYISALFIIKSNIISNMIIYITLLINISTTKPIYELYKCTYGWESDEWKEYYNMI